MNAHRRENLLAYCHRRSPIKVALDHGKANFRKASVKAGLSAPEELGDFRDEQARSLRSQAFLFSILGFNTVGLISMDFWTQFTPYTWVCAALVLLVYIYWMLIARRFRGPGDASGFVRSSISILAVQGCLWALIIVELAELARPEQRVFVTAVMMGLLSTSMLGSPFAAAIAFFLPAGVGCVVCVACNLDFDSYMSMCFAGYIAFTFYCIVFINRTLLNRSVSRALLDRQNTTVRLLLREFEQNAAEWLWETGPDHRLRAVSERFAEVAGTVVEQLEGRLLSDVLALSLNRELNARVVETAMEGQQEFQDLTLRVPIGTHERRWSVTGRPMFDRQGALMGYWGFGSDVTAVREAKAQVLDAASTIAS